MTLRVLSLFSGAGGADLALEAAGMSVAALCEIEPHARAVLREHWPDVPLHGDVQTLDGTQYRGKVDIVVGGSPCQDLSVAGKRAGLTEGSGTRSSLFHDQVRIWQESQATYLIWENVKGAFSSSQGADFAAVLSAIVGRTVAVRRDGWANAGVVAGPTAVAAWRLLDLQHFGVPQRRERIVVLAARAGGVDPAEVLAVSQSLRWDSAPRFQAREGVARDVAPRAVAAVNISNAVATLDDVMGTLDADGASTTSARADGSPCADRGTNMVVQAFGISSHAKYVEASVASSLRAEGGDLGGGSENLALGNQMNAVLTYDARGNGNGVVAEALISAQPGVPRRLMPIECERLMGWPDSWTRWGVNEKGVRYELADTPRYKLCGNGIGREWMEWVALRLMEAEGLTSGK